jgi:hypothetical protein
MKKNNLLIKRKIKSNFYNQDKVFGIYHINVYYKPTKRKKKKNKKFI